jgi:hypothetical protein
MFSGKESPLTTRNGRLNWSCVESGWDVVLLAKDRTDQEVLFEVAKRISSKLFHLTNAVEMEAPDVQ